MSECCGFTEPELSRQCWLMSTEDLGGLLQPVYSSIGGIGSFRQLRES